jgi:hypothetical protein
MAMEISVCAGGFLSSRSFSPSRKSSSDLENALEKDCTRNNSRRGTRDAYLIPVLHLHSRVLYVCIFCLTISVLLMIEF